MRLQQEGPATAECTYVESNRSCHEPAVGELRAHMTGHGPWPMCERHLQKDMHPADLHRKLVRWPERQVTAP